MADVKFTDLTAGTSAANSGSLVCNSCVIDSSGCFSQASNITIIETFV